MFGMAKSGTQRPNPGEPPSAGPSNPQKPQKSLRINTVFFEHPRVSPSSKEPNAELLLF
jgi:hypothetical protein